ncbi:MAG: tape measure protein, partial [Tannerellaceae bacterium]|nr:tape measure protein [Tannerellaceae bacterium]
MAGLALDIQIKNLEELSKLKAKMDEVRKSIKDFYAAGDKVGAKEQEKHLKTLQKEHHKLYESLRPVIYEFQRAGNEAREMSDQYNGAATSASTLTKAFAAIGGTAALIEFTKKIIDVRGEIQQIEIAFETMLGSKGKADAMMADIKRLALSTPFTLTEVVDNTKQLIAMGIAAEEAVDTVKALGDVAAGVSVPLSRIAINYGQVAALGKLQQREINDFAMAGIPVVEELGKQLGKTKNEIYEMAEAGEIGFRLVEQAFKSMSGEGGKFYNMMEAQSASVAGQISKLQDSIQLMFNNIGQASEGIIYSAIGEASALVENYEKVGKTILELVAAYGAYKVALIVITTVEKQRLAFNLFVQEQMLVEQALRKGATAAMVKEAATTKALAMAKLNLVNSIKKVTAAMLPNPYILAAAAVAALAYGIYKLVTYQTEAEKAQKRLNDAVAESEKNALSEQRELSRLKGSLNGCTRGTKEFNDIKNEIVNKFGKYRQGLDEEIERVGSLDLLYQSLSKSIQASFDARQYEKFKQSESDNLDEVMSKNLGKIQDRLINKLGDEAGSKYYTKIREAIFDGKELDAETKAALDKVAGKGGGLFDITNRDVEGYIQNIIDAQQLADHLDKKAKIKFGISDGGTNNGNPTPEEKQYDNIKDKIEAATKAVSDFKQQLADLRNGKTPVEAGQLETAIEAKEKELQEAEKRLQLLTGIDKKAAKSADDKQQKRIEAEGWLLNKQTEIGNERLKAELETEQKLLKQEDDSFEKRLKLLDLNYRKELLATQEHETKMAKEQQEAAKRMYIKKNGDDKGFDFAAFDLNTLPEGLRPEDVKKQVKELTDAALEAQTKGLDEIAKSADEQLEALRLEFASEHEKRLADINKRYDEEVKAAKGNAAILAALEENRQKEINKANREHAAETIRFETEIATRRIRLDKDVYLFRATAREKELREQKRALTETLRLLYEQYAETPTGELAGDIKAAEQELEELNAELSRIPVENIQELLSSFQKIAGALGKLDGEIGEVFSSFENAVDSISEGFEFINKENKSISDYAGQASNAIAGIVDIINMVTSAAAKRKDAEKEFYQNAIAMAHEYALALNEQLRTQSEMSGSGFLTDYAEKIKDGFKAATDATDKYYEAIGKLSDGKAKIDLSNAIDWGNVGKGAAAGAAAGIGGAALMGAAIGTVVGPIGTAVGAAAGAIIGGLIGIFGGKKKKEEYGGLLEVFPDLVDSAGQLNRELAEVLINTGQLDDNTKQLVQNA